MLKVVEVIGLASTGAYEGDASGVTRTKIVRIASLGSGHLPQSGLCRREGNTATAEHDVVTNAYVCRLLHSLAAPEIVEAILDGRQPKGLRLAEMLGDGPVAWEEQRGAWRFSPMNRLRLS
jgi:hypothetical protein